MIHRLRRLLSLIFLAALIGLQPWAISAQPAAPIKTITWDDLLPTHWANEIKLQMAAIGRLGFLVDGSEQANEAMQQLRKKWDNAPIDPTHINSAIRIAGYVVSLDANRKQISEFLLVPYFGACIHLPPPPANQIILVRLKKPTSKLASMDTVWVQGTLREARVDTGLAVTGYTLEGSISEPYSAKNSLRSK
ncbi:MAG: hypothetical protein RI937_1320 [Pseudomonadota bacterium]|jgi:hypothetical protein|nr:DUF3299 domain-containing protein [Oxalobacteraceae bacterium]